ncbi:dihydrofolate reductase [Gordonia sp. (in: high G+C Gram-positive bacteria)]|uniref:dihydrofolate reductase n=1 Tax=Gordonia sp. (in: high G+C Gram-positive bacteria) TaxID=84139 RepID=UPI003C725ECB
MSIALVWAQDRAGAIGKAGTIPWRVPEDMKHFKEITGNGTVIMGRKTWESLPASFRPLPGRRNIVITRTADYQVDGAEIADGLDSALAAAGHVAAVIGGGQIYAAAMDLATHLRVTEIDVLVEGADAFAPPVDPDRWTAVSVGDWLYSSTGTIYRFVDYLRR